MPLRSSFSVFRRNLPAILSVAALVVAGWLWADRIDYDRILGRLASIDPLYAGLSWLSLYVFAPVNAYRLKAMTSWIAGVRLRYAASLRVTCIGSFVAATAPIGLVGDAAKVALMRPLGIQSWRTSIQCVIGDRASGAIFVACLGMLMVPVRLFLGVPAAGLGMECAVFAAVLAGTALVIKINPLLLGAGRRLWEIPGSILSAVAMLFAGAGRVAAQFGFAAVNVALTLSATFLLARGMALPMDVLPLAQFIPVIILVTSLPFLYLGWGGRELVVVSTVGSLPGVTASDALSLSIALGTLGILAALPNGLFLLIGWRRDKQSPG